MHSFPFTDQIPCGYKPFYQQSLTQTFFWDTEEENRRKGPNFKAKENEVCCTTKTSVEKIVFFFPARKHIKTGDKHIIVDHALLV
jgi:hypothetical protein